MNPWRLIVPWIPLRAAGGIALATLSGAIVAGIYGILHDQVTYSISEEYFTRFKFFQFHYARPSSENPRVFAAIIGFLATWWVGALVAWVLARISLSREGRLAPAGELAASFGIVFLVSMAVATGGWCWGLWRRTTGYASGWLEWMGEMGVENEAAFMTVGYIHNASYLGGSLGMMAGIFYLRHKRRVRLHNWLREKEN